MALPRRRSSDFFSVQCHQRAGSLISWCYPKQLSKTHEICIGNVGDRQVGYATFSPGNEIVAVIGALLRRSIRFLNFTSLTKRLQH
jgi:hypothetical protein